MDEPTRRLDEADAPPEHPTRRLTEAAPLPGAAPTPPANCPECGGPLMTTRVRLGTGDIVVESLTASARDLLIHQSSKAKGAARYRLASVPNAASPGSTPPTCPN